MVLAGKDFKTYPVPSVMIGIPCLRPGHAKLHPIWFFEFVH